jgi:cobalt-zinc-cadmium resistance protein CzcA
MLERVLQLAIERRWLIVLFVVALAGYGVYSLQRLPIDAVPDITNNQVQINTVFAGFSPVEIEQQITFPVGNGLSRYSGLTVYPVTLP